MGRKEDRKLKKLKGESLKKTRSGELSLSPIIIGDKKIIPINTDNEKVPSVGKSGEMTPEEFMKVSHTLSDKELNRIIYQHARDAIEEGVMPPWPEDDFGVVMWFAWNFITDEMRESFPAIAREYLAHYRDEERNGENPDGKGTGSGSGAGKLVGGADGRAYGNMVPKEFDDIPYPRLNETTWDDAYYFRVLLMMLACARQGSVYSRNFLISLYKVYYKAEYNKVKRLKVLTYLDVLELHDEDCLRRGLSSGHTLDGNKSFKEMTIERRRHEPGWTDVFGDRPLSPAPGKRSKDHLNSDVLNEAAAEIRGISESPDEPPLQPVASRLYIMCELLGIEIDQTCNGDAAQMNGIIESMSNLTFLNSPEYRKLRGELVERAMGMFRADCPEMFDPYEYQKNERYMALQVAELVMQDVFKKYDTNVRMPYDSRAFNLPELMADMSLTLHLAFPGLQLNFDESLILSMVQYLSECLCEVLAVRDAELDEILRFHRRKGIGEWDLEEDGRGGEKDTGDNSAEVDRSGCNGGQQASGRGSGKDSGKKLAEKVLRTVESLRKQEEAEDAEEPTVDPDEGLDEEGLRAEIARLRGLLEEKEIALAETEQKVIRQRVLYEKSRERELELERKTDEQAVEHAELIALREFVYGLKGSRPDDGAANKDTADELDENAREQIIGSIKDKKVAVLGGTERWIKRMKRILPTWTFIAADDDSIGGYNALERAGYIYVYTSALKHSQYYRAMNLVKSTGKMLFYLDGTNMNENLRQFQKDLCRRG